MTESYRERADRLRAQAAATDYVLTPERRAEMQAEQGAGYAPNTGRCEGQTHITGTGTPFTPGFDTRCVGVAAEWDEESYSWLCTRHAAARRAARARSAR